jgi:hypothetical protein
VSRFSVPRGFPLDDAWIHQVVARTLAETGVFGFDPSLPGSGATSWLWPALLAANPAFIHISPPLFAVVLAGGLYLGVGQLVFALCRDDELTEVQSVVAALAFTGSGNFVWFALSGMETMLVVFLSLAVIHAYLRAQSGKDAALAGATLVTLFFTRPEAAAVGPLLLVVRRRGIRDSTLFLAPVVLGAAAYFAWNAARTGRILPMTFEGRRWLAEVAFTGASRIDVVRLLAEQWLDRIAEYTLGTPLPFVFFPVLGLAFFGVYSLAIERRVRALFLVAFAVVEFIVYAALLPSTGHGGRYQPFVPAAFCLGAAVGALALGRAAARRWPRLGDGRTAGAVALLPIAFAMARALVAWGEANDQAVAHEENTEIGMAHVVSGLPKEAVVASFDIGAMGYFSGRSVEDLGGLVRPRIVPFLREGRTVEWLRAIHADYLVLPLGYRADMPEAYNFGEILGIFRTPEIELVPVEERVTPPVPWLAAVLATSSSAPRQRLYRVHFPGAT